MEYKFKSLKLKLKNFIRISMGLCCSRDLRRELDKTILMNTEDA